MPPRHPHLRPQTPSCQTARRDAGTPGWARRREPWRVRGAPLRSRRHPQALPPLRGRGHRRRPPTRAVSAAAPAPERERLQVLVEPSSRFSPRSLHELHGSDTQGRSGSGAMLGCGSGMAQGLTARICCSKQAWYWRRSSHCQPCCSGSSTWQSRSPVPDTGLLASSARRVHRPVRDHRVHRGTTAGRRPEDRGRDSPLGPATWYRSCARLYRMWGGTRTRSRAGSCFEGRKGAPWSRSTTTERDSIRSGPVEEVRG